MAKQKLDRGLDLDTIDTTTPEEIAAFRSYVLEARQGKLMYPLSAYTVLLNNRPDMLKLHFRQMHGVHAIPTEEGHFTILTATTMLHWYVCNRYEEGIIHEIRGCQGYGASKEQVNEILAIAFMHCGPSGFRFVYHAAFDYLQSYIEPEDKTPTFPANWAPDPTALKSGMDFSSPDFTADDKRKLFSWYEQTIGEVPRSVQFLAKHNPTYLKADRGKLEGTMRGALPKQLLPFMLLHYNMNRGFKDGMREAALLGKAWGMTKAQLFHALTIGVGYMTGLEGLYIAEEAVGDILDD